VRSPQTPKPDELTPDELQSAVALAADLYQRDIEHTSAVKATEELDIPQEYLARAISTMLMKKREAQERVHRDVMSARNIGLGVLVAILLGAAVWQFALTLPSPTHYYGPPTTAQVPSPRITVEQATSVHPLPYNPTGPFLIRSMYGLFETNMTFNNTLDRAVSLFWLDNQAQPHFFGTLGPGESTTRKVHISTPWLVYKGDLASLSTGGGKPTPFGLFITGSQATTAIISEPLARLEQGQLDGYLKPLTIASLPPNSARIVDWGLLSDIEFVNFSGKPVRLYSSGAASKAAWITNIGPGEAYYNGSGAKDAIWIVTDLKQKILATYRASAVGSVAVITPDLLP